MIFDMTRRIGGGGGPSSSDAILLVTVPAGSTVTATKGGVTLTPTMWVQAADNTLEIALFAISPSLFDSQNAWTVAATLGTDTVSDTVVINSNKEYDVELSYHDYLFRAGTGALVQFTKFESHAGSITIGNDYISDTDSAATSFCTTNQIDLTDYDYFKIEALVSWIGSDSNWYGRAVVRTRIPSSQAEKPTNNTVASVNFTVESAATIYAVDVSQLTGPYNLGFAGNTTGYIYNMWLE